MKRTLTFLFVLALLSASAMLAQSGQDNKQGASQSVVDNQIKILTQKLGLSAEQQAKIRPIMQELYEETEKIKQDKNLTRDERLAIVRPKRQEAGQKMRVFLTEDQKQKLAEYLKGPHRELHDGLTGNTPPAS